MAKSRPVYYDGQLFYPVSVFEAIVDPTTRRTLKEAMSLIAGVVEGKVDKVDGKGLSANDLTNDLKTKLEGLENYDDRAITDRVVKLEQWKRLMTGSSADDVINTFKEIEEFLAGVTGTESLSVMLSDLRSSILREIAGNDYQDTTGVNVLIAQALTPYAKKSDMAAVAFSGRYGDLTGRPQVDETISPTSDNAVKNKAVAAALSGKADKEDVVTVGATSMVDYDDITSLITG